MRTQCAECAKPLSDDDPSCLSCQPVPGRMAVGTVVVVGRIHQEPIVDQRFVVLTRVAAALTCLGLLGTVPAGGLDLIGHALLVAGGCVALVLVLGCVLWTVVPARGTNPLTLPMRSAVRDRTVDVSTLSVKEISGATVICDVRGAVRGPAPVRGDVVEVYGRRTRTGAVLVRQFVDRSSGAALPVRLPAACVTARLVSAAIAGVWVLATLAMAWLLILG